MKLFSWKVICLKACGLQQRREITENVPLAISTLSLWSFLAMSVRATRAWVPLCSSVRVTQKALGVEVLLFHKPEASWENWSFTANKRAQERRSRSLMNCVLKEIHVLPVAWLYSGTCFFNGDRKQTFWQDQVLLRAIYVLFPLKLLGQTCPLFEKTRLYWGVMELSLILRCNRRKIFDAGSCQVSVRSPGRI